MLSEVIGAFWASNFGMSFGLKIQNEYCTLSNEHKSKKTNRKTDSEQAMSTAVNRELVH